MSLSGRLLLLALLAAPAPRASTIEQCIGHCAIYRWGPSRSDLVTTERQPSHAGTWDGHSGQFYYWDLELILEPFVWYDVAGYTPGATPMGPVVYVGWRDYITHRTTNGGVWFFWFDPGFENDPAHEHMVLVTTPVVTTATEGHAIYLWQCEQGIDPPYPPEPWPEPGTLWISATGLALLAAGSRRRSARPTSRIR